MEIFWYLLVVLVLGVFFVLDGYDFGTGIIHLFFAKKEKDKVVVAKAAGLFWDSNEVWLVAGGGMLFAAFPLLYATAFSGFYLPLVIVLWMIVFRAIGLEFRSQFKYQMWKDFWDKAFGVSSLIIALLFGIALGNVARGVNLGGVVNGISTYEKYYFFLPLWNSSFSPTVENPGVIDWFTLTIGLISVVTLAMHGANWVILKTNASINEKLKIVVFKLNIVLLILAFFSLAIWHIINPNPFKNFLDKPYLFIFPTLFFGSVFGLFFVKKFKKESTAFFLSTLIILGGITSTLASMFPVVLPSTNSVNESLTIYNTAATTYGLQVGAVWGLIGITLIMIYFIIQKRLLGGKIDNMDYGH